MRRRKINKIEKVEKIPLGDQYQASIGGGIMSSGSSTGRVAIKIENYTYQKQIKEFCTESEIKDTFKAKPYVIVDCYDKEKGKTAAATFSCFLPDGRIAFLIDLLDKAGIDKSLNIETNEIIDKISEFCLETGKTDFLWEIQHIILFHLAKFRTAAQTETESNCKMSSATL